MLKQYSEKELLWKPLTQRQKEELLILMDLRDEDIDLSDIPEIREIPADATRARGRHFKATQVPVFLDPEVQSFLMEKAATKRVPLDRLVNDLLKGDIETFRRLG